MPKKRKREEEASAPRAPAIPGETVARVAQRQRDMDSEARARRASGRTALTRSVSSGVPGDPPRRADIPGAIPGERAVRRVVQMPGLRIDGNPAGPAPVPQNPVLNPGQPGTTLPVSELTAMRLGDPMLRDPSLTEPDVIVGGPPLPIVGSRPPAPLPGAPMRPDFDSREAALQALLQRLFGMR